MSLKAPLLNSFLRQGKVLGDGITDIDTLTLIEEVLADSIGNLFKGDPLPRSDRHIGGDSRQFWCGLVPP